MINLLLLNRLNLVLLLLALGFSCSFCLAGACWNGTGRHSIQLILVDSRERVGVGLILNNPFKDGLSSYWCACNHDLFFILGSDSDRLGRRKSDLLGNFYRLRRHLLFLNLFIDSLYLLIDGWLGFIELLMLRWLYKLWRRVLLSFLLALNMLLLQLLLHYTLFLALHHGLILRCLNHLSYALLGRLRLGFRLHLLRVGGARGVIGGRFTHVRLIFDVNAQFFHNFVWSFYAYTLRNLAANLIYYQRHSPAGSIY